MKNYNKILEAINRGIKFALDDFNDQEDIQGQANSKVKYKGGTKEWLDLMNEVVDLDLPSGTLWCKYNLDVDPNQLSKAEDWYGKYYAWGELEPNKTKKNEIYFNWSNYKYGKDYNKLTKYCNNYSYGLYSHKDNLTKLLSEDDAAYQFKKCHNFKFHIPTKEQLEELLAYTKNYWVNNYDPNKIIHNPDDDGGIQGLDGYVFEEKNKNQLFIPAAGYCCHDGLHITQGCIWTNTINIKPDYAYDLVFDCDSFYVGFHYRCYGFSIRPVVNL